jgi:hypothetical protein
MRAGMLREEADGKLAECASAWGSGAVRGKGWFDDPKPGGCVVCRCGGSWRLPSAAQLTRGLMQASWLVIWLRARE